MLMQALVRTPDQHDPVTPRAPLLKSSIRTCLLVAGLQELATTPGEREWPGRRWWLRPGRSRAGSPETDNLLITNIYHAGHTHTDTAQEYFRMSSRTCMIGSMPS